MYANRRNLRVLKKIGVEEHDGDVRFWTGSGNIACICLRICVCVSDALTFESLRPGRLFSVYRYIFRIFRSRSYIKVIGSRSRSPEQKSRSVYAVHRWFTFD